MESKGLQTILDFYLFVPMKCLFGCFMSSLKIFIKFSGFLIKLRRESSRLGKSLSSRFLIGRTGSILLSKQLKCFFQFRHIRTASALVHRSQRFESQSGSGSNHCRRSGCRNHPMVMSQIYGSGVIGPTGRVRVLAWSFV